MKINNDDLRKIYRAYIQEKIPISKEKCPSSEKLLSFFMSSGSSHKKGRIIDHVTGCAHCAQEFSLFREIYREERRLLEEIDKLLQQKDQAQISKNKKLNYPNFRGPRIFGLHSFRKYVFASLLTIIFVAMLIFVTDQLIFTKKNDERGKLPRLIQLIAPTHEKAAQSPVTFKWKGMVNSNYYILEIFDGTLSPVWKSPRILANFYHLPPDIEGKIEKNKIYFWMITVFLADGTATESSLEDFTLIE